MTAATLLLAVAVSVAFERTIEHPQPGPVAVVLDAPVYESARLDLADVRVIDDAGRDIPCLLRRYLPEPPPEPWQPPLLNRSDVAGESTQVTLDLGTREPRQALQLDLSGDEFRRRVRVEAGDDGESWRVLTDAAWVFAAPGPPAARFETVRFPVDDRRYLRVTVFHGEKDSGRVRLRAARVVPAPSAGRRLRWIEPRATRAEDAEARETRFVLELGARHTPFSAVAIDVADARFFRRVEVQARREPLPEADAASARLPRWIPLGSGDVHRQRDPEGRLIDEKLEVRVSGRARALRLVIENRDDPPLRISEARVAVPEERIVFVAEPGRRYRLRWGEHDLRPREWDLGRSIADVEAWADAAEVAATSAPTPIRTAAPEPLPWSERHPRLMLGVLALVVAGLGGLTWKTLRSAA